MPSMWNQATLRKCLWRDSGRLSDNVWISHKQGFDKGSFSSEKKKWETDLGVTLTMKNADGHEYVYPSKYVYFYRCTEKKKKKKKE